MMNVDFFHDPLVPLLDLLKIYDDCTVRGVDCDKCPLSNVGTETEDCLTLLKAEIKARLKGICTVKSDLYDM